MKILCQIIFSGLLLKIHRFKKCILQHARRHEDDPNRRHKVRHILAPNGQKDIKFCTRVKNFRALVGKVGMNTCDTPLCKIRVLVLHCETCIMPPS